MKVLMINVSCGTGSTGRICTDLAVELENNGHNVKIAYGRDEVPDQYKKYSVKIGNDFDVYSHVVKSRLFDGMGFGSKHATKKFIEWVKEYDPDIIHLHNIHGYYINIEILFEYLKKCGKKIIWTLHDCWAFTGHCAYFDYVKCSKWENECNNCPQKSTYPARIGIDFSKKNYERKKNLFTGIPNLIIVTPSLWLKNLVEKSFLKEYSVFVINNGVNIEIFHPVKTDIKKKYGIDNRKKIVLGVASVWDKRKGIDDFIQLSTLLSNDYQIVLIGVTKKQKQSLPKTIIGIERTENIYELVAWYSIAEIFVNPTYEDNYPTTNIESIACGTPVITYDTGGSGESAKLFGCVTEQKQPKSIIHSINLKDKFICQNVDLSYKKMIKDYLSLYI